MKKHQKKTKPFLQPYVNENVLIHGKNTQNRPDDLIQNDRSELFICLQTWHINRCNRSTVKAVNVLLQNGCIFILTERFCQDAEEEYFGIQKQLGITKDNPDMKKLGCNDNTIRIQRDVFHF